MENKKEKREKQILLISFVAGLIFAIAEFGFAIYSHSQSVLTDAFYDFSEIIFVALLIFLTPLFHKPVSEKHPYGFFQIETIFVIIKSVMMLSVSMGISAQVIESAILGGNIVNGTQVSVFQSCLGFVSIIIFLLMKKLNKDYSSPTIETEMLGWKIDVFYSIGMAIAFFLSNFLKNTSLSFLSPYFDQIVAIVVMIFALPESIKFLWNAIKEIFLFSPDKEYMEKIKILCNPILESYGFNPVFFDVTKTGRHIWIAIYFQIDETILYVKNLEKAIEEINESIQTKIDDCTCELILIP